MSLANEIRLYFVMGLLLLGALAVALRLGVPWAIAAWRGHRDRVATRAAEQARRIQIESGPRERRLLATQARRRPLL